MRSRVHSLDAILQEAASASRVLWKNPSFAVLAILTSTLGIAAATCSFSVVDAVLLRPLPYREADRLVQIWATLPILRNDPATAAVWDQFDPGYKGYEEFRKRQTAFEQVGAFLIESGSVLERGEPRHVRVGKAEASVFRILGVPPFRGRSILDGDEKPDAAPVAMLGYEMWMREFGADPNVSGRRVVILSSRPGSPPRVEFTIVGVLPQGFRLPVHDGEKETAADLWTTRNKNIPATPSQSFEMLGKLKPGISATDAEKQTAAIFSELPPDPSWPPEMHMKLGARVVHWREQETSSVRKSVWLMFAASSLLLLIACANVANLLLDRAAGRRHELALRFALGASRARVVMQLLVESIALAAAGGLLGAISAALLIRAGRSLLPIDAPYGTLAIDVRVLFFAIICSVSTGVLFGLLPALVGTRIQLASQLKDSATNRASGRSRVQRLLIIAEISISFVLLVAAALITRSLVRLEAQNPGFPTERLLTLKLDLSPSRYSDQTRIEAFYRDLLPRLKSLPGVLAITARQGIQFTDYHSVNVSTDVVPENMVPGTLPPAIETRQVLPNYFEVLRIPVIAGRSFTAADVTNGPFTISIVNQSMARAFWPGQSAVNQRLGHSIVVGVVDDPKEFSLGEQAQPVYYIPGQLDRNDLALMIRTAVEPESLASTIRREVRAIDPELPTDGIKTMENLISASETRPRDRAILIGVFGVAAIVLVLVGLYGVISRSVSQRTRELGIRIAIGAKPREVLWLILRQSLFLAGAGVVIGSAAAFAAMRLITSFLFGITATDISTYAMIAASVIGMSLAAAYIPARRAARIDPADCLRTD